MALINWCKIRVKLHKKLAKTSNMADLGLIVTIVIPVKYTLYTVDIACKQYHMIQARSVFMRCVHRNLEEV